MSAVSKSRELSQFGSFLYIDDTTKNIAITTEASPNVGIGTTIPTSKLTVVGNGYFTGVVTATSFYGNLYGTFLGTATTSNYANFSGLSTLASGIVSTSNLYTSGIVTASAFYVNETPLVDPILQVWFVGVGNSIYRLNGNVGIGTSFPSQKLSIIGNASANQFISTATVGTSPFQISSNTLVTNLNADFLRGKIPPSGDLVGTTDPQTLTNKTLTSPTINSASLTTPTIGIAGAAFSGSTSGNTTLRASAAASGTLTLPASTDTLVARSTTDTLTNKTIAAGSNTISGLTNSNLSGTANITNANLANSTISGISLGSNLNSLSIGSYLSFDSGTTYNGSTARTINVKASSLNDDPANFPIVARDSSGDFTAGTITATNFNSTSDETLKTNIKTVENSLETIKSLRGVSFDWKESGNSSYGIIAQELELILPDLVNNGQNKSVNYNGLIGILIEAVKEQQGHINSLRNEIDILKKLNNS